MSTTPSRPGGEAGMLTTGPTPRKLVALAAEVTGTHPYYWTVELEPTVINGDKATAVYVSCASGLYTYGEPLLRRIERKPLCVIRGSAVGVRIAASALRAAADALDQATSP